MDSLTIIEQALADDHELSIQTYRQYRGALRKFEAWRGDRPLSRATVEEYARELTQAGVAKGTVNVALSALTWRARKVGDIDYSRSQGGWKNKKGGRKPLDSRLSGHLYTVVPLPVRQQFAALAEANGKTLSAALRSLVIDYVEANRAPSSIEDNDATATRQ